MTALLKKDYIANRFLYLVLLLIAAAAVILSSIAFEPTLALIIGILSILFVPITTNRLSSTDEMRKHYDLVMNSFPVERKDIVVSRYIYYMIIFLVSAAVLFPITIKFTGLQGFDLRVFVLIMGALFLYYTMYMGVPNCIYFCADRETAIKYSFLINFVVLYMPIIIIVAVTKLNTSVQTKLVNMITAGQTGYNLFCAALFGLGIVTYVLCMVISVAGYKKRDLN